MTIVHPAQPVNNINPEDIFYAVDDMGTQTGFAYILYQLQHGLYPDCPVNMYFSLEGDASSRYLLFGALIARARILQTVNPTLRARLYTGISPEDTDMREFYLQNGFDCDETDACVELMMPYGDGRIPMSCNVVRGDLSSYEAQEALVNRLRANDIGFVDINYLNVVRHSRHFLHLGLHRTSSLIGEAILAGDGTSCELIAIYVTPENRCQGMAKALLHRSLAIMASEGVTRVTTRIMTRSLPQQRLMNAFGATPLSVNMIFPGMYLS